MGSLRILLCVAGLLAAASGTSKLVRYQAFQLSAQSAKPVLGRLDIPRLQLSLPVLDNDDPQSLALSVGHIPGTSAIGSLGNAGIAGHRDMAFRSLRNIRVGDRIETHMAGDSMYIVKTIHIVDPGDTRLLREGSTPTLTLVTCYPFDYVGSAPHRFVIQAEMTAY